MLASLTHFILCYFSFCPTCHHLIFSCILWFDRCSCSNTFLIFYLFRHCYIYSFLLGALLYQEPASCTCKWNQSRFAILCPTDTLLISNLTHAVQIYPQYTETTDFFKGNACSPHYCDLDSSVSLTRVENTIYLSIQNIKH